MMRTNTSPVISRNDYQAYGYKLSQVRLIFDLDHSQTQVVAELDFICLTSTPQPLMLNGEDLELIEIKLDGQVLDDQAYTLQGDTLSLTPGKNTFTLAITSICRPQDNTALMGLYTSGDKLFTQCEAEGFRRITWFPDRPDVMSTYHVTLRADRQRYPLLLSNGNLTRQTILSDGRHEAVWEDPHPKPSYLFALVAGDFDCREKTITTKSGRGVLLQVFSDTGTRDQTAWALDSLERALRWDEAVYGLELDLDRFMIVAARDFNMGAMENKGLNIFNATYVLADKVTATDATHRAIEAVIGHEYFHNWTGNRVTCRDWFQLSLKEGLTVFREQDFSADMLAHGLTDTAAISARAVKRIEDVNLLRNSQFPEDAGPIAHPIRPESYHEISNFYTATIYEKGAEVIRMLHTLLGPQGFRQGLDEYFRRHDGQAVTCDDFLDAMETVYKRQHPEHALTVFRQWYSQAGTPRVDVTLDYDAQQNRCTVTLSQHNAPAGIEKLQTPIADKPPLHIPFDMGFLRSDGSAMLPKHIPSDQIPKAIAQAADGSFLLELTQARQSWTFKHVDERPIPSLLRSFSAPVIVNYAYSEADRILLAQHDSDPFARWEAVQELTAQEILQHVAIYQQANGIDVPATTPGSGILTVWQALLNDTNLTADYRACALTLIAQKQLLIKTDPMDPLAINWAHNQLHVQLGSILADTWLSTYLSLEHSHQQPYDPNPVDAGQRALRLLALGYLLAADHPDAQALALRHYHNANNLTDRLGALKVLTRYAPPAYSTELLADFHQHTQRNAQLLDNWFSLQANAHWASVDSVRQLMQHPEFSLRNPNRARALIFQFCLNNPVSIHTTEGHAFWAEQVLALNTLNPEIAARLARGFDNWTRFVEPVRTSLHSALKTIHEHKGLSSNVHEIIDKALNI